MGYAGQNKRTEKIKELYLWSEYYFEPLFVNIDEIYKYTDLTFDQIQEKYSSMRNRNNKLAIREKLTTDDFLSFEEFVVELARGCFYCGKKSTGLDRIDSGKLYIIENVVSCCSDCNTKKSTLSLKDFVIKMYLTDFRREISFIELKTRKELSQQIEKTENRIKEIKSEIGYTETFSKIEELKQKSKELHDLEKSFKLKRISLNKEIGKLKDKLSDLNPVKDIYTDSYRVNYDINNLIKNFEKEGKKLLRKMVNKKISELELRKKKSEN